MQQIAFGFPPEVRRSVFSDGGRMELIYRGPFSITHPVVGPGVFLSVDPMPLYLGEGFTIHMILNPAATSEPGPLLHLEKGNEHGLEILRDERGHVAAWGVDASGAMWSIPVADDVTNRPRHVALTCDGGYLRLYTDGVFRREGQCRAPMPITGSRLAVHHRGGTVPTVLRVVIDRNVWSIEKMKNLDTPR